MKIKLLSACVITLATASLSAYCPTCVSGKQYNVRQQGRYYQQPEARYYQQPEARYYQQPAVRGQSYNDEYNRRDYRNDRRGLRDDRRARSQDNGWMNGDDVNGNGNGWMNGDDVNGNGNGNGLINGDDVNGNGNGNGLINGNNDETSQRNRDSNSWWNGNGDDSKANGNSWYDRNGSDRRDHRYDRSERRDVRSQKDAKAHDGRQLSDSEIEKRVRDELSGGWFSNKYQDVHVEVSNGAVVLSGTVDSKSDSKDLEKKVKKISGVRNVRINVEVRDAAHSDRADHSQQRNDGMRQHDSRSQNQMRSNY
ncbi:MAG: BON domain-containing protein [Waddliaceae bacterium]